MENHSGEQLQPLTTIPNLLPIGQQDPLTLIPLQPNPTLAPLNLANPTDQQILSIITGDNPDGAFQTVAKYSSNPLNPSPLTTQTPLYPLPFTLSPNSLPSPTPPQTSQTSLLDNTSNSLTLEQLSRVESTAVNIWQNLLPDRRQLDVNFQITDLANGEIAQAQVTKFSPTGLPIGGTILIDRHAQGAGWFVDSTPLDWNEFTPWTGGSFQAKPDSAAAGKYDLFTALLHELGHISGFGHGDTTFDSQAIALSSDKNHLDGGLYAHDLMASGLELGERRLPSALDVTLAASPIVSAAYAAPLLGVGITNGDFSIANDRDANYSWQTNGATTISNGVATLSDTSKQLANLTQKFLIPTNANTLQFTIKNSQLRSGQTNATPNDSFEVALLDAQMNPLAGKAQGLANTDSLLNLQADGTVYFSDKVKIGGVTTSGSKIANTDERTVTIDLAGIAGNTEAMLYFDLLSFGSGESNVTIDNVKIFTQAAPQLQNANLATNQATGLDIPLPNGVTFNSIELGTQPQHGTVVRNPLDGKITYTPKSDYVGTDSFTYLGFSPDGQISNPATINITVNNVAPKIDSVVIPPTAKEGQTVQLQATASDGGSSNNLTYSWNLGDGSNPMVGQNIAHTFADNGTYNVTLTVTDKDGGISQQTTQVLVDNVAPTVNITAPVNTIDQGGSVQFGVNYSDAGIQDTHTITWNFGDGSTPVTGVTNPNHLFTTVGDRNVTVTVTDNDGASTTQLLQIAVNNVAPTINSIDIPTSINEGQLVQLTATASDPGNDALTYNWYVNNATTPIVGQTINYTFADNGVYPVKLNVIDSNGAIITQSVDVTVNNVAPIIVAIVKPDKISEGELVEFRAVATDVGINDTLTYTWNFGDNTSLVSGQKVNHVFTDNGNYNITLTVKDKDGATTTQTTSVKVDNVAPIIVSIFKPELIKEGQQVEFQATATDAGINDSLTYNWNFGDNTNPVIGQNATHTFADNGNYNVILTVTDKDGASTIQTTAVTVDNVAPSIISIAKPTQINEGQSVSFAATATDPGILDTLTYSWNFGDNTNPAVGQNATHTFADNGNYDVVLTVTDNDGISTTQTVVAKVDNVAPTIVSIVKPSSINEGEIVEFKATTIDPGVNDTLIYSWNFGDNTALVNGQNATHIFADNGDYNVILTVTDKDGSVTTQTVVAKVNNIAPAIVAIVKPDKIDEGQPVQFTATATDPGINDTLTYSWNFGDNTTPISGQTATHTFANNGDYNVVLTVTDKDGAATTQAVIAKVNNVAPVILTIDKPTTIKEGESVQFIATTNDPGINDTLTYAWNFGDNTTPVTGQNVTHTFADNGNYNVTLTVTDKDGAVTTQTVIAKVDNVSPIIVSIDQPTAINEGESVLFKATATDVGINDTLTYSWNFGDNTTPVSGQNVTHTFADNGTYNVTLTVTDKDGAATTQTVVAKVDNVAPAIVSIVKPATIKEGESVTFTATATDPGMLDTLTYSWNFGDNTNLVTGQNATHTFTDNGDYNVILTVTDKDGAATTQTVIAKVDNVAPTISSILQPDKINEGQPVEFKATATDAGINDTLTYSWNFGDSTTPVVGQNATHTFADNGNYNVVLTVTDKDGAVTTQTVIAKVDNVAPVVVSIDKPTTIKEGESVQFTATAIDPGINDTLTYSWNFGDNTTPVSGQNVNHTFTDNGNYNVTLTLTDKDGGVTTQATTVKVDNLAPTVKLAAPTTTINQGETINLGVNYSDPGIKDTHTITWNFDDGSAPATLTPSSSATQPNLQPHQFTKAGTHTVTVTVTDNDGANTTDSIQVTVTNLAPTINSVNIPTNINEGSTVQLTATASDAGNDTLTYNWYINGATTPIIGQTIDYNFANSGSYPVKLVVIDRNGGIITQTVDVAIANVAPVINSITIPSNIQEGSTVQLKATASDAGNDVLTYNWYINNSTIPIVGQTIDYKFLNNGIYQVKLEVTDSDGAISSQTVDVTVKNIAPTIDKITIPTDIKEGEIVQLQATASDPGNSVLTYKWYINNSTIPIVGSTIDYTFTDNGIYPVQLEVIDTSGAITTQTVNVTVANVAPVVVSILKPDRINEGESVSFTATATDPGILDTLTYSWNFGDNTELAIGQNVNHTFADNGNYNVVLTVTDKDGASTTQTVIAKVDNVAPAITSVGFANVNIDKPATIKEGESVTFTAIANDPGILDTLTYSWNFGDNTTVVSGQTATHTFADNGNYQVVLTVTDKDGAATTQTLVAKVDNVAPAIVSIIQPDKIDEGQPVEFKATATDPGSKDTLTYSWSLGDNTTPVIGENATHTFADNGNYSVVLTVTDKDGAVTTQTVTVKVDNVAPTIVSIYKPTAIKEGESVLFKATATDVGINDTLTYNWNFGDNTNPVSSQNVNHIFADNGNYNVVLTVTDKDGGVTTQTVVVKVDNVVPAIVSIDKPTTLKEGESVLFKATATDAGINDTLTYSWNFGDNTTPVTGQNATHTFADNGNYNVVLTVTDKDGGVTTQTVVAKVDNVVPTIVGITKPNQINEGQSATFTATANDPGTVDTLTYSWNFGDNTSPVTGANVSHIFADNGNYNVVLTVTDKDGGVTTQTVVAKVDNVAPTLVSIVKPTTIKEGESVTFAATATDPGILDTLTYSWNFGDNTTSVTGQTVNHAFADNGNYNVVLTVTDKDGAATTQTVVASVDNVAPTISNITKPTQINEGQAVAFSATATDPGTKDTLTYSWNFGDNTSPISGQNVNHIFADNGNYNVVLTVTDKDGAATTQTVSIFVDNVAPVIVNIVKPEKINEGQSVEFKVTATDVGTIDTLTYTWNFGDATSPVSGQNATHTFAQDGNYNVVLTVTDKDGGVTTQTIVAKVDNVAPSIVNIVKPDKINEGQAVTFSATANDPGTLDTLTYSWNFGDNTAAVIGQNTTHTFVDNGNYNVILTVTDKDGGVTTQPVTAKVDNVAPTIVSIHKPTTIKEGESVLFKATATDVGILDALTYSWNFGDNTTPVVGQNTTHTFVDNGNYNIVLTITDKDGAATTETVVAKVDNVVPMIVTIAGADGKPFDKPATIKEGESVLFKATATDPGILDTLTYSWNFGDNTTSVTGQTVNHAFADNGNYNVVLTVTDKDGGVTTQTVSAKVDNVAPVMVSIDKPTTIKEGESVSFKATATDAGINDTLTYSWNFGDNTTPVTGQNVNHTFADNGNYNVTLTVTDKDGAATLSTVVAKVDNVAPTIVSIVKPNTIKEGESITFSATATDPGTLDTLTYSWNFGDNTNPVSGRDATHTFADNGNYNVVLTVTDKDGGVTTQTIVAKVDNVAPTIVSIAGADGKPFDKPTTIKEGESVLFKATATDVGIDDTLIYSWNFGDNTNSVTSQSVNHTFDDNGSYNVTLTVTDKDGGVTTQTVVVKVDNVAPTVVSIVKPTQINEGQSVTFTATATDPGILDTLIYSWNFGDATTAVIGQNATHTFADNGNYNVTLTVTDKDGGATTQTIIAKVDNVAPVVINIDKPATIKEGESVSFKATATDVGTLDTLTYNWNFGDNTSPISGQNANHIFADNGNYNVTLTVTDKDGAATTQTIVAKVDNVAPVIVNIDNPTTIKEGESAEFKATATDVGTLDTLTYSWNFGDNNNSVIGQNVNHIFADNGNYNVVLTVTDKDGGVATQTVVVKVDNVAPTIVSITKPDRINEGQSATFAATATDPGTLDTLTYSWNFGDSTTPVTGQNVNHTFVDNGNYNVVLTVTDKDGGVTSQTTTVKVDNVAPAIFSITKPDRINEGQSVTFAATANDPGTVDTLTYSWNFGDSTPAIIGQTATHTFADNGNYNVVLTVTDKDGGVTTQTVIAKVDNVAPTIVAIVKPDKINEGQAVAFSATADDPGTKDTLIYSWNFGDNTDPVIGQNITHTFSDNGNYNLTLTVTDKDGGVTTQTVVAKVDNVVPTIVSIIKPTQINEGQAVAFTATVNDPGILDTLTYAWNFGDNTNPVIGQNTTHTFADNGNYNVVLTVTDKDGGVTTQTVIAKVDNVAPAIINIDKPATIKEGEPVQFKATATDVGINDTLTYSWNFGDNTNPVSGQNATHTFTDNGNYNVVLTVTDKDGGATSQTTAVKVDNVAPAIVNIIKPDRINEGQAVTFSATANDPGVLDTLAYSWNFGDATNPIAGKDVTHQFVDNGTYNVVLTVTDKDGGVISQATTVKVDNVAPEIVNIIKPETIKEGESVLFKATATNVGTLDTLTYNWYFGDNTNSVNGQNVNHTFVDNGNYNIVLTVTDKDGAATTQTVLAKVDNVAPTVVSIVKPTTINEGQAVTFAATAIDPGTLDTLTYSWNFGDNTPALSGQNVSHSFADNGNYNVTVTVTDKDGGVTTQTVVAKVDNVAPTIVSIVKPDKIDEGQLVEFKATATDAGINDTLTYSWNFGDNTTSVSGQNVSHIFADNGSYSIVLTLTDKDGGVTTQTVVVKVDNVAPAIVNIIKPDRINEGQAVQFTATANDPGILDTLSYSWNFGDNTNPVNSQNAIHTWSDNGNYTVLLTVTDKDGAVTTQTVTVKVDNVAPAIVNITKPTAIKEGESVLFKATATDPGILDTLTYSWNFGDNTTPVTGQNVNHIFADNGNYNVVLTVTDKDGGVATQTVVAKVDNVAPVVINIDKPATIKEGEPVTFTATATDPGSLDTLTYSWNFGDTTAPVIGQNAIHTFADNGTYNVVLTLTDKDGASTTQTVVAKVDNIAPTIVSIAKPNQINEGQAVEFTATANDPSILDTLTYSWNFGDNTNLVTGQNATHTFIDNGNYDVVLTVTDKDGGVTTQATTVKVNNLAPTVKIATPTTTINQGETINLGVNYSDPGIKDTHTITWNFDDGSTPVTGVTNLQPHQFTKAGNHNVTVTITDNDGASTTDSIQITITNLAPTISNVNIPTNINEGSTVQLTATASDAGNDTLIYNWYINGATTPITGSTINYTFIDNGSYPVKLDVLDSDGAITTQTVIAKVDNVAPTILSIAQPDRIKEGQSVAFSATATDPGTKDTLTYSWNFGDNTAPEIGQNPTHTFADNGNYGVILTITDKDGAATTQTVAVKVDNVAPTVQILSPTTTNQGENVNLGVKYSDPGTKDTHTITWNFGDGSTPVTGVTNPSHIFTKTGTHKVSVTVTDNDGASTTESVQIAVTNVAPTINTIDIPTKIDEGSTVQLTATASDAGNDILTYNWYINGATTPIVGQTIDYKFSNSGSYPVKLVVIDSEGGIVTRSVDVTINNLAPTIDTITIPTKIKEGDTVKLQATATDTGNDALTYNWYINNSITPIIGQTIDYTFTDNGVYPVKLAVIDADGAVTIKTTTIAVENVPPIVSIIKPDRIDRGHSCKFRSKVEHAGKKDHFTQSWNFGDGSRPISGTEIDHTFTHNGRYDVTLTVTDDDGITTTETTTINVVDVVTPTPPPLANPSGIFTINQSGQIAIDYLYDGGDYKGQMAIFSLEGMDKFQPGSQEYIQEAIRRSRSNSTLGYTVIDDTKQTGLYNHQDSQHRHLAKQTYQFTAGDKVAFMLLPTGGIDRSPTHPFFSFDSNQISDLTGKGEVFGWEDLSLATADKDYNDVIFRISGAVGIAAVIPSVASQFITAIIDRDKRMTGMVDISQSPLPAQLKATVDEQFGIQAVSSTDSNQELTFRWYINGSTQPIIGNNIEHTFTASGNYSIKIIATNDRGLNIERSVEVEVTAQSQISTSSTPTNNSGIFTVDRSGQVSLDYLFDGGDYQGQMGIFSLEGMEQLQPNSPEYLQTAIDRATSNSNLGYMAIDDSKQTGSYNFHHEQLPLLGIQSFNFKPGTKVAFILFPHGKNKPHSIANCYLSTSKQMKDLTGKERVFGWEDISSANGTGDYNDLMFEITGGVIRNV